MPQRTPTTAAHPVSVIYKEVDLEPPPSPPKVKYSRRGPTRFEKESAATGGKAAADLPGDPRVIGPWRIGRTIGKGACGRVKIAKHSRTGVYAAVKIIQKNKVGSKQQQEMSSQDSDKPVLGIEREIVIMKLLEHPNVMGLYDVWETSKELYLILEYVEGGELFDYLVSKGRLHPDEASRYFQQVISAVDYCHRFNICHRDLKPENILLDGDRNVKIADFGMAALEYKGKMLETSCGSPHYASPEIVSGLQYHGAASDIWSCGVILYALLTGRLPFDDENIRTLLGKVKTGKYNLPEDMVPDAKDLISRILVTDPEKRITMREIIAHPFCRRRQATDSGRQLQVVEAPCLDAIDMPVRSVHDLDKDIVQNLQALFKHTPTTKLVHSLLAPGKTWEKSFYWLLLQYRERRLENYNPEDYVDYSNGEMRQVDLRSFELTHADAPRQRDKDRSSAMYTPEFEQAVQLLQAQFAQHAMSSSSPDPRAGVTVTMHKTDRDEALAIQAQLHKHHRGPSRTRRTGESERSKSLKAHRPTRPAPAVPETPRPGTASGPSSIAGTVHGPRAPRSPQQRVAPTPSTVTPGDGKHPKITVQRPTPQPHGAAPAGHGLGLGMHVAPPSPSPAPASAAAHAQAQLSLAGLPVGIDTIAVPQVQDAALQKFFQDIANQLALIGSASPRSSIVIDTPSPSPSPKNTGSPVSLSPVIPTHGTPLVSAIPVGNHPVAGQRRPVPQRTYTDQPARVERPEPVRRRSYFGDATSRTNTASNTPAVSRRGSTDGGASAKSARFSPKKAADKLRKVSTSEKRKSRPTPLDLDAMPKLTNSLLSPGNSPYLNTPNTLPPSPLLVGYPNEVVKGSWFSNLFSWKPATYSLICAADCMSTRIECVKLLESFGASVVIEDADGWGILKCRVDEIRDVSGIIIPKAVRFRIEFLPHALSYRDDGTPESPRERTWRRGGSINGAAVPQSPHAGARTSMTMVQEKGALSAFRAVYARIRAEWSLNAALNSPRPTHNAKFFPSAPGSPISPTEGHGHVVHVQAEHAGPAGLWPVQAH